MDANPSILQGWKQAIFLGIAPPSPHNLPLAYVYIEAIPYVDLGGENNRREKNLYVVIKQFNTLGGRAVLLCEMCTQRVLNDL